MITQTFDPVEQLWLHCGINTIATSPVKRLTKLGVTKVLPYFVQQVRHSDLLTKTSGLGWAWDPALCNIAYLWLLIAYHGRCGAIKICIAKGFSPSLLLKQTLVQCQRAHLFRSFCSTPTREIYLNFY